MLNTVRNAFSLLRPAERRRYFGVLLLSALAAVVQTLAIISIMPFIWLLTEPGLIDRYAVLSALSRLSGAEDNVDFLVLFGTLAILALTIGNAFLAIEHWLSSRFLANLTCRFQISVLERVLARPFSYFSGERSARLSDVVLNQSGRVSDGVIGQSIVIASNAALAAFVVIMLLTVSFRITLTTLVVLVALFLGVFLLLRRRIYRHGEELTRMSGHLMVAAKEVFDGIREIKLRRAESFFTRRLAEPATRIAELGRSFSVLNSMPHFLLEAVIFAGLIGMALYVLLTTDSPGLTLSLIALYGLATYRLVPALQSLFDGLSHIQHNADAVAVVRQFFADGDAEVQRREVSRFQDVIRLDNVSCRFPGSREPVLDGASLEIAAGSRVCLFGPSGSGKSTALNLIAGLVSPDTGRLLCDGVEISSEEVESWQRQIGFCPQQIFLFDDSLAANVAFGVAADQMDTGRVRDVVRLARVDAFVTDIDDAVVAEHGKNLSGGQAQRIGIARALYHDPPVLIFDEAFKGLDAGNRDQILDNLLSAGEKTIVFASHDPVVAARCDRIVTIRRGRFEPLTLSEIQAETRDSPSAGLANSEAG